MLLFSAALYGQAPQVVDMEKGVTIDTNTLLIIFALFLLLPIWILSNAFIASAKTYSTRKVKSGTARMLIPFGLLLMSSTIMAQDVFSTNTPGLSAPMMTILLVCVICAELFLIIFFATRINDFIRKLESQGQPEVEALPLMERLKRKWDAMHFKPIEEEHKLDTGHSYDGIRELDNVVPPWFTTAFLLTIVFAIGYIYRYHIAKSAPMQTEEYEISVAKAELEHDEYLKTQASNIDESNVALMTGAELDAGKKTFIMLCAACHKSDGGGLVGPNLCDDYWIHGGSLQHVFKTIKYGVPDKGMISWKEQLTPSQIAQVANYILTLKGSNPPDAKDKQGELYVADASSSSTSADSLAVTPSQAPIDSTTSK